MTPPNGPESNDAPRKQRREQAREQRKAIEQAQRASAVRRRRMMQLGGLVLAVVVIIVVIVVATSGGGTNTPITKGEATSKQKEVISLLKGIPQEHNRLGDAKAPVTLAYYGDLECPICQDFTLKVLPTIIKEDVRTGKLKVEYHSFSTATGNAENEGAEPQGTFKSQQIAALAAGEQDKGWDFIELFYHEQGVEDSGYVTENFIQGIAKQVPGLNLPDWTSARGKTSLEVDVDSDDQSAIEHGFEGTPSFLVGKTGTTLKPLKANEYESATPYLEEIKKFL